MQLIFPFLLVAANAVAGQSLADALASQNSSLSTLNGLLAQLPGGVSSLASSSSNITILAPNNDALTKLLNSSSAVAFASDPSMISALLSYHVLNGTYYASNFSSTNDSMFIPTMLTNETHANVTGGQRVEARMDNGNVTFFSGLMENSSVVTPNINFTGGTIHIVNSVLSIPLGDADTLIAANLTAAAGALMQVGQAANLTAEKDITIFAPTNDAFSRIGNLVANISNDDLLSILDYHVIPGHVEYSTMIMNGTVTAANGKDLTFTVENGTVFVNSAKVIQPNLLVANGVIHIIDNVLNPQNTTATPDPTASTQSPAFSGATSTSAVPFTSGVQTPTSTAPVATASGLTSSSTGVAVPMKTGAVGAAALFGGAAVLLNL